MSHDKIQSKVITFSISSLAILIILGADAQVEDTKSTNVQQTPYKSPIPAFFSDPALASIISV
jgi:hypothetical protein